jgi:hypothetical protein
MVVQDLPVWVDVRDLPVWVAAGDLGDFDLPASRCA